MVVSALALFLAPGSTTSADAAEVRTDGVCFTAHNEGDPIASQVYGVRNYRTDPDPRTPVLILVHGNSVTHHFWDVRPDFSVARRLADAGYLVIAYDRLGYGQSPYPRPHGAGYSLTISSQRSMLHEIVGQVKTGHYTFADGGNCSAGGGHSVGLASPTVVIVGHSAGGAVVSGYPGRHRDVAAMVQAGYNNQGFPPEAGLYLARVWGSQAAAGEDYWALAPTVADCERTVLYQSRVVPSLLPQFCQAPRFGKGPAGEPAGAARMYVENKSAVAQVGPGLPVLLAWMDHDFFFPDRAETDYWKAHCGLRRGVADPAGHRPCARRSPVDAHVHHRGGGLAGEEGPRPGGGE